jgi:predicted deacetylase
METVIAETDRPYRIVEHARGGRLDGVSMRLVWELEAGPTTTVTLTFWTSPPSLVGRIREFGRERWWRRRWARALARMREVIESGADVPRVQVAGTDRVPIPAG